MTKLEYYQLLRSHDWNYQYSDDFSVYTKGHNNQLQLQSLTRLNPEFVPMYQEWLEYIASCWEQDPLPIPEPPKE